MKSLLASYIVMFFKRCNYICINYDPLKYNNFMKHFLLVIFIIFIGFAGHTQTATNFTCNDCSGGSHDLFTELDAGKVIILCWVMPCSTCIPASKTTYNVVNSYQATYPNRVFFYLVDDLANTVCSSLGSWGTTNTMPESSFSLRFSNAAIKMTDYGSAGMPKIVVLGGTSHSVFYNVVSSVNATDLQAAINSALESTTGFVNLGSEFFNASLFSQSANNQATLSVCLKSISNVKVELYNVVGKKVAEIFNDQINAGTTDLPINTSEFTNGIYFVKVTVADRNKILKFIISN
jgi:hypothetical protein